MGFLVAMAVFWLLLFAVHAVGKLITARRQEPRNTCCAEDMWRNYSERPCDIWVDGETPCPVLPPYEPPPKPAQQWRLDVAIVAVVGAVAIFACVSGFWPLIAAMARAAAGH